MDTTKFQSPSSGQIRMNVSFENRSSPKFGDEVRNSPPCGEEEVNNEIKTVKNE